MNSALKKINAAAIDDQWIKGEKNMVMEYANNSLVELMYWIYIQYGKINPGDLMEN